MRVSTLEVRSSRAFSFADISFSHQSRCSISSRGIKNDEREANFQLSKFHEWGSPPPVRTCEDSTSWVERLMYSPSNPPWHLTRLLFQGGDEVIQHRSHTGHGVCVATQPGGHRKQHTAVEFHGLVLQIFCRTESWLSIWQSEGDQCCALAQGQASCKN